MPATGRRSRTFRPQSGIRFACLASCGDRLEQVFGLLLVRRAAPVEHLDRALVLPADAQALELFRVESLQELPGALASRLRGRIEAGARPRPGRSELESLVSEIDELGNADHPAGLQRAPSGHAGDQGVPASQARQGLCSSPRAPPRPRAGRRSARGFRRRPSGRRSARAQPETARAGLRVRWGRTLTRRELVSPARVRRDSTPSQAGRRRNGRGRLQRAFRRRRRHDHRAAPDPLVRATASARRRGPAWPRS